MVQAVSGDPAGLSALGCRCAPRCGLDGRGECRQVTGGVGKRGREPGGSLSSGLLRGKEL